MNIAWTEGCNKNFALVIVNVTCVGVCEKCLSYSNAHIYVGQHTPHDSALYQICMTYNSTTSKLYVYCDLQTSTYLIHRDISYATETDYVHIV